MAAEPARLVFAVKRQPLKSALVGFAIQAGMSISTRNVGQCSAQGQPLAGPFTLEDGLATILAGTGCTYRRVDARAFDIVRSAPPRAAAPPPQAPHIAELPELVVLATRRPTPAVRLAIPVSSADASAIASQRLQDASDLALATPSMTVTNLGPGRNKILLRGLSDGPLTGRTQAMVGIYLDDSRITYNAPDPDLLLVDMAQVEVLRGPQGALYGAGSLGGVLHLATQAPSPDAFAGWISGTGAATQGGAPSTSLEGMVNLPLFNGRAAARFVAYHEVHGGYIDDPNLGLKNVNRSRRAGERGTFSLDINENWKLMAGVVRQTIYSDDTQYVQTGQGAFVRRNFLREPHDNDFTEAHVGLNGRLGGAELRWSTALVRHELQTTYDATSAPPVLAPAGPAAYHDDDEISSIVSEATLTSPDGAWLNWLAGGFYARTRQKLASDLTVENAPAVIAFDESRRDRLDEVALFGQATAPLSRYFHLTVGGRLFSSRKSVSSVDTEPLAASSTRFSGKLSRSGVAPKVVLAYDRWPAARLYVQAAEGYRMGGANTGPPSQAFTVGAGVAPSRYYRGDELWSFEAGGRFSLLEGRLNLRAAVFEALWRNIQSDQLLPSSLPYTDNIGDGKNKGFELEANYRAGALLLHGAALINEPELDHPDVGSAGRADLGLAGVPKRSASASVHYSWALQAGRKLELDSLFTYVGGSRLTFDATTAPRMGDYVTGRIAATVATEHVRLTAALENPFNTYGDTFSYGNPFSLRTTRQVTPLRPRTVSLTMRVSY
jgi:iron complex outermembrane receptor protein